MIDGRSVLGLITARGGSKGVPGKNILMVGGRPLIQWSIDAARQSRYLDRLILSSDDPAIMAAAEHGGCEVPFRRDAALATDAASSSDVVADALTRVPGFDIVVLLQPTSPLRTAADIDAAIELMISSGAPACVSVCEAPVHPAWIFRLDGERRLSAFVDHGTMPHRRQDLTPAWCLNGAVYVADCDWFLRGRAFVSPDTVGYPMPAERSLDIDTMKDVEELRRIVSRTASDIQ